MNSGYLRIAAVVPTVSVADCNFNVDKIISNTHTACEKGAKIILFPELSISSCTCGDLFWQAKLLNSVTECISRIKDATKHIESIVIIGAPLRVSVSLCNCAIVIAKGSVLGVVPKTYLSTNELRWFTSGSELSERYIDVDGEKVPFGSDLLFVQNDIKITIEIGDDLFSLIPPSSYASQNGANVILNLSSTCELIGSQQFILDTIKMQSSKCKSAYIYASAGFGESTTDKVYPGNAIIYENGNVFNEASRFERDDFMSVADVDIELLNKEKLKSLNSSSLTDKREYREVLVEDLNLSNRTQKDILRPVAKNPFIPNNEDVLNLLCEGVVNTQVNGLIKRLTVTGVKNVVVGVSGGLDSTLALLVCHKAFVELGYDLKGIKGITMPGFGTTDRTYTNALNLMAKLEVYQEEISIKESVVQHFKDISHDINIHDVTYENSQARERTQILMDYSNKCNGMVIGTGDLSELALGWATYNGDHMSMYGVNADVPKTLVQHLVRWIAMKSDDEKKAILLDIIDTPISPELVPADDQGNIKQKTEDLVGPYELHDFYLYHILRNNYTPGKIYYLAKNVFKGVYTNEEIKKWLTVFCRRFFQQQFKRSCLPDGPQIGTISLSPRGGLTMPSDASARLWLEECDALD